MAQKTTKTTKTSKTSKAAKTTRTPRASQSAPKQGKPVFRTGTWIALIVLAVVIGAAFYMNQQAEEAVNATETPEAEEAFVFTGDSVVTSIEVKPVEGETIKLERDEENVWVLSQPSEAEADQSAAEAAASQINALRIIDEVDAGKDPSIFGFDEPAYTITVSFEDGTTNVLEIGDMTPSQSGYYLRVDGDKAYVVGLSGIDALSNLVFAPPYLNTPTPVPTATSTPLPTTTPESTTEDSSTPEATATP